MIDNTTLLNAFLGIDRDLDSCIEIKGRKYGAKNLLKDLKINAKVDKDGSWIGLAVPKMLKAELINDGMPTIEDDEEIRAFFGVKVGEAYQYINVGSYYAYGIEYSEDRKLIKITAYDKLKTLQDKDYGAITYPITVGALVDLIATRGEITVDKSNLLFLDYNIQEEVFFGKDKAVIELIRAVAQASACFAYIGYDNVLRFKRPIKIDHIINAENVFKFRFKDYQKKYNALVLSRQPQNDDVALKADNSQLEDIEMKLSNNPILDLNREFFIGQLLNVAKNLPEYNGLDNLNMQSNPLFEVGDIVTFMDKDVIIFEHEMTMARSTFKSQITAKTETDFKKAKGIESMVVNTELRVDKVKHEILATIGDEVGQKLTELRLDEEGIKQRVANTVNTYVTENAETLKGEDGKDAVYNLVCLSTSVKDTYLVSGAPESTVVKHNTSEFIEVKEGADYTFSKERSTITSDQTFRYAFYNANKEFISQSESIADLFTLKAPEGASFLRVSYPVDSKPMIEQGTVDARNYAPHPKDVVAKSDFQAYQEITNNSISQRVSVDTYNSNNEAIDKKIGDVKLYVNNVLTNFEVNVDKIKLEGYTTINGGFSVDLQGNIIANSGRIGNFNISQVLRSNNDGRGRYLQLDGRGEYDFLSAGYIDAQGASKPWTRIDKDGKFYAMAGEIGGWQINTNYLRHENASRVIQLDPRGGTPPIYVGTKSGSTLTPQFQVLDNGSVYVKNGGVIGNWEVTPDGRLIGGKSQGVTIQLDPRGLYSPIQYNVGSTNYFSVNKDGSVYSRAMNANGSFRGESYGYGSFSGGSYSGSGYLSSGTLGGSSFSTDGDKAQINSAYFKVLVADIFAVSNSRFQMQTSSGVGVFVSINSSGFLVSNSDIRLKENIRELGHEYDDLIYSMPLIKYTYKSDKDQTPRVGVNANYLMKILPEYMAKSFLHQDEVTGLYGANYELLVPYTIKAIQANHEEINKLKEEIRRLRNGKNS